MFHCCITNMKLFVSLLLVITLSNIALGDETDDTGARVCPVVPETEEVFREKLNKIGEECSQRNIESSGLKLLVERKNATLEEIRTPFKAYCDSRPAYSQCLDSAITDAAACLSELERTKFRLFRQYKEMNYEEVCGDNGDYLAQVFKATVRNGFTILVECRDNATSEVPTPDIQDPNGAMIREYKIIKLTLECLNDHRSQEHDLLVNTIISLGTGLTEKMKCVKDEADVLCKTIIDNN